MIDWVNSNSERGECIVGKRKIVVYNQMLMMLILTFLVVKNGFDVLSTQQSYYCYQELV